MGGWVSNGGQQLTFTPSKRPRPKLFITKHLFISLKIFIQCRIKFCKQSREANLSLVDEYFMWCSSFLSGVWVKIFTIPSTSPMALCLSTRDVVETKYSYFTLCWLVAKYIVQPGSYYLFNNTSSIYLPKFSLERTSYIVRQVKVLYWPTAFPRCLSTERRLNEKYVISNVYHTNLCKYCSSVLYCIVSSLTKATETLTEIISHWVTSLYQALHTIHRKLY